MIATAPATYRMIAIDLDGTLLSPRGEVSPRTKVAVRRALDAGLLVCFATGRAWTESRLVLEAVDHYPLGVFAGGAMIVDTGKDLVLHRTHMQPDLSRELCRFLESRGFAAMALQDRAAAGFDYLLGPNRSLHVSTELWIAALDVQTKRVPDLGEESHEHTIRVGVVADHDAIEPLYHELNQTFGERVVAQRFEITKPKVDVLEVFDPAVNKWEGIRLVAARHGVAEEQIIAIGDDINDLPMLEGAGLGVAMGNARPQVLAIADRIVGSNANDGLAEFLDQLVDQGSVAPPPG